MQNINDLEEKKRELKESSERLGSNIDEINKLIKGLEKDDDNLPPGFVRDNLQPLYSALETIKRTKRKADEDIQSLENITSRFRQQND